MTQNEIYQKYLDWREGPAECSKEELFESVIGNKDVYEDENILLNYLFYQVREFSDGNFRCFSFYEANLFTKDNADNLELAHSVLILPDSPVKSHICEEV